MLDLCAGLCKQRLLGPRAIAFADAFFHSLFEKAIHRFAVGSGVVRELVTQIVESELQSLTHDVRVGNGFGNIAKERGHLACGSQGARGVCREQAARQIERSVKADRRQHVQQFAILIRCSTHAVGGNDR